MIPYLKPPKVSIPGPEEFLGSAGSGIHDILLSAKDLISPFWTIEKKPEYKEYKDDWLICPNCGLYYVEPHACMIVLGRKGNVPSQSNG